MSELKLNYSHNKNADKLVCMHKYEKEYLKLLTQLTISEIEFETCYFDI